MNTPPPADRWHTRRWRTRLVLAVLSSLLLSACDGGTPATDGPPGALRSSITLRLAG